MKRMTLALTVLAVAVAAVPATAKTVEGSDPNAKTTFQGQIQVHGDHATLRVKYTCASGQHLWVSAKQVASRKKAEALTKEGSSGVSAAYLMSHRNPITCDGEAHTATFTVDKVEEGTKGRLKKGKAYVQFCVTTETGLTYSKSAFVTVK